MLRALERAVVVLSSKAKPFSVEEAWGWIMPTPAMENILGHLSPGQQGRSARVARSWRDVVRRVLVPGKHEAYWEFSANDEAQRQERIRNFKVRFGWLRDGLVPALDAFFRDRLVGASGSFLEIRSEAVRAGVAVSVRRGERWMKFLTIERGSRAGQDGCWAHELFLVLFVTVRCNTFFRDALAAAAGDLMPSRGVTWVEYRSAPRRDMLDSVGEVYVGDNHVHTYEHGLRAELFVCLEQYFPQEGADAQ
jgi:hypothetical protein